MKNRQESARVAREKVQELWAERDELLDAGGDRLEYAEMLKEAFCGELAALDYTSEEIAATVEEIQVKADPVAELEGLVATLRAFRELGALDELRAVLEEDGTVEVAGA